MKRIAIVSLIITSTACANESPLVLPVAIEQETPFVYPEELWDEGVESQAVVMVHVTADGAVDSVYVRTTSGYEAMDTAAARGARELRFEPGRRGEDPVDVWVRLPVRFSRTPPEAGDAAAATPRSGTGT